jgi:D-glycerate 3-kinase
LRGKIHAMAAEPISSFAAQGPAFAALQAAGAIDWPTWERLARLLEQELPPGPLRARRIHHLTLPILFGVARWGRLASRRPVIVGISAPQGAGKSTLARTLVALLADLGLRAATVSIDDFYLTFGEQERLAAQHPDNPYLRYRGYPGTHDLPLGAATLQGLRGLAGEGEVLVPVYDKSAHGGRGDRLPATEWRSVHGPLDLILIEGWMLGFCPVTHAIEDRFLVEINARLTGYEAWLRTIDTMVILRAADSRQVLRWRVEAEEAVRAAGMPALDRAEIEDYVRRFLPAYDLYADTVAIGRWSPDRQLVFTLDADRLPR